MMLINIRLLRTDIYWEQAGCYRKDVFFPNPLHPIHQSSQRNATVKSPLLVIFWTTNSSQKLGRERWQNIEQSWKKTLIFSMNGLNHQPFVEAVFQEAVQYVSARFT